VPEPADIRLLHPLVAVAVVELEIGGEVVPCDPDAADTADFCATYGYEMEDSANTIVVVGKAAEPVYAACVVLATTKLAVNSVVRKRLGTKKASFASGDTTKELTDMEIGGVTVVGLPVGMPLWVDAAVMERERIILGGGNRSSKLVVAPTELLKVPGVEVVEGLAGSTS
jgi:prolyl-tRNA editing enzyme YbaK/EbsC (Cys-tRNA(Pro) deacylase)